MAIQTGYVQWRPAISVNCTYETRSKGGEVCYYLLVASSVKQIEMLDMQAMSSRLTSVLLTHTPDAELSRRSHYQQPSWLRV